MALIPYVIDNSGRDERVYGTTRVSFLVTRDP